MKSKALLASFFCVTLLPGYRVSLPGYRYQFPADFYSHPAFRTEWWYYTGNLHSADGVRRFGFELTFFRQGVDRPQRPAAVWDVRDVWLAHLALSDLDGHRFFHTERLNRSGAGIAGAEEGQHRVWNGNWEVKWSGDSQQLQAVADQFRFQLSLQPIKPPVVHGADGISQKSAGAGHASNYFSQSRLQTKGTIEVGTEKFQVEGLSWMDHEFFTHQMEASQSGWDWFSLQFDDGSDLMLYRLRRKDGSSDPYSSGTYIDPQGRATHLKLPDATLVPGKVWKSPATGGQYPINWTIRVPSLGLDVALSTRLPQQELTGASKASPAYWEGAIEVTGTKQGHAVKGAGYLEMTGYAGAVNFGG